MENKKVKPIVKVFETLSVLNVTKEKMEIRGPESVEHKKPHSVFYSGFMVGEDDEQYYLVDVLTEAVKFVGDVRCVPKKIVIKTWSFPLEKVTTYVKKEEKKK